MHWSEVIETGVIGKSSNEGVLNKGWGPPRTASPPRGARTVQRIDACGTPSHLVPLRLPRLTGGISQQQICGISRAALVLTNESSHMLSVLACPAGGISPGSMPPNSRFLEEEGAAIVSFKLVRQGAFQVSVWSLLSTQMQPTTGTEEASQVFLLRALSAHSTSFLHTSTGPASAPITVIITCGFMGLLLLCAGAAGYELLSYFSVWFIIGFDHL